MTFANQKGTVLTFVIVGIGLVLALSAGTYYFTSTSATGSIGANNQNQAYHLARAGIDYYDLTMPKPEAGYYTLSNGDKFQLEIDENSDEIISTGIVGKDTPYEAKRTITVRRTAAITGIPGFTTPAMTKAGLITTDTVTGRITLGKIGDEFKSQFGVLWYTGSGVAGICDNGRCDFGTGFRAFFVFQINASAAGADGFTFAFFNGDPETNDVYSAGGHSGMGELLGYAGDSRIDPYGSSFLDGSNRAIAGCPGILGCAGGRGIQPPKIAVEFDPYTNYGTADVCASGSRRDGNESPNPRHHAGYVFWGTNDLSSCTATIGRNSYDDNRHNAGTDSPSDPRNSRRPSDGADTSYYNADGTFLYNWLTDAPNNIYAFRVEVKRSDTANPSGNYEYEIKSWVKPCTDIACTIYDDASSFANTKADYTEDTPTLLRTIELTEELHKKFATFFFGWTMATGGATEEITIARFRMYFKK